jgi:chaperone required for assembly of F1-ATPase
MKRFYQSAGVRPAPDGFAVLLDDKPLRTPVKAAMVAPTLALAQAIAAEWQTQGETITPAFMPLTQLTATAIDGVRARMAETAAAAAAYGESELICYRAEEPAALARLQAERWQPLLEWAADTLGARLVPIVGIIHHPQSPAALTALRQAVEVLDGWHLTAVQNIVGITGSLILALAMLKGRLTPQETFALAQLDETYQIERWGEDAEAARRRRAQLEDLQATAQFLSLLDA